MQSTGKELLISEFDIFNNLYLPPQFTQSHPDNETDDRAAVLLILEWG